jgi:hypothetical protein
MFHDLLTKLHYWCSVPANPWVKYQDSDCFYLLVWKYCNFFNAIVMHMALYLIFGFKVPKKGFSVDKDSGVNFWTVPNVGVTFYEMCSMSMCVDMSFSMFGQYWDWEILSFFDTPIYWDSNWP